VPQDKSQQSMSLRLIWIAHEQGAARCGDQIVAPLLPVEVGQPQIGRRLRPTALHGLGIGRHRFFNPPRFLVEPPQCFVEFGALWEQISPFLVELDRRRSLAAPAIKIGEATDQIVIPRRSLQRLGVRSRWPMRLWSVPAT
jgi:hypothetical protein